MVGAVFMFCLFWEYDGQMSESYWHEFPKEFQDYLIKKYGDNRWWESDDYLTIAYYQINEPKIAVKFSKFHEACEKVLDRSIWTHQFCHREVQEEKGMYRHGNPNLPTKTQYLCYEDIQELINDKWRNSTPLSQQEKQV